MRTVQVSHTEEGYDPYHRFDGENWIQTDGEGTGFITFYFKSGRSALDYGMRAYKLAQRGKLKTLDMSLQRPGFGHATQDDPDHFHTDGDTIKRYGTAMRHIHFIYKGPVKPEYWEELYEVFNSKQQRLQVKRDLPHRVVEYRGETYGDQD